MTQRGISVRPVSWQKTRGDIGPAVRGDQKILKKGEKGKIILIQEG